MRVEVHELEPGQVHSADLQRGGGLESGPQERDRVPPRVDTRGGTTSVSSKGVK
jgi:hypothetical protein